VPTCSSSGQRIDFVKHLEHQLRLLRDRRFEELDVDTMIGEFEGVVGHYRGEPRRHIRGLIAIVLRDYDVYGDWTDLKGHMDILRWALEDSPSLVKVLDAELPRDYEGARLGAALHGEPDWPETCPWRSAPELFAAVAARDEDYLQLERSVGFGDHRAPRSGGRRDRSASSKRLNSRERTREDRAARTTAPFSSGSPPPAPRATPG
jgi:hypothetical protein